MTYSFDLAYFLKKKKSFLSTSTIEIYHFGMLKKSLISNNLLKRLQI